MGMFDTVEVLVPLPDGWEPPQGALQTKEFDCELTTLRITSERRLLRLEWDAEWVPLEKPNRLGFKQKYVKKNERWVDLNFTGRFIFYGSAGLLQDWHEYEAEFVDGLMVKIMVLRTTQRFT